MNETDDKKLELLRVFPQLLGESMLNPQIVYKRLNYEISILNNDGDAKIHCDSELINISPKKLTDIKLIIAANSEMLWDDMKLVALSKQKKKLKKSSFQIIVKNEKWLLFISLDLLDLEEKQVILTSINGIECSLIKRNSFLTRYLDLAGILVLS